MDRWLINGEPRDRLPVTDRGLHYGDGLFETMALRHGRVRFLQRHLRRLQEGCLRLLLPIPGETRITDEIEAVVAGAEYGTLKLMITRGNGPRGYRLPQEIRATRILGFSADSPAAPADEQAGMKVMMCRTRAGINPFLAGMKTLNRLENVLAAAEWQREAAHEGLMFDAEDRLVGGTMSNVFLVVRGALHTPALGRSGVHGVMRAAVMDLARALGVTVLERDIGGRDIDDADSLFLTNALMGLKPVDSLAGRSYQPCMLTRDLVAALREEGHC